MCLVVDYSEKSVKSDYFGVIIYNWWRKVQKIGIFAIQNAYFAESGVYLQAEYTKNSGYSMRFFRKIGKFAIIGVKLGLKPNKLGRTHRKFAQFATLHNTTQISEKFSPIVSKIWHFLKCHNNCSHTKISKEQLTAHTSIVKRITVSVTNTHLSSSNALLCQLVSETHKLLKQLKPMDIANYNINRYNGSFFSY